MKQIRIFLCLFLVLSCLAGCTAAAPEETQFSTEAATEPSTEAVTEAAEESLAPQRQEIPQPGEKPVLEEVPEDAEFFQTGSDTILMEPAKGFLVRKGDPYRDWYNLGSCKQLRGNIQYVCIFIEDDESTWNKADYDQFYHEDFYPGMEWLMYQAREYGVELGYESWYYGKENGNNVRYDGTIGANLNLRDFSGDILTQAAQSLGFASQEEMDKSCREFFGVDDDIVYILVVNKPGRCYAMIDQSNEGIDFMEYVVLYNKEAWVTDNYYYGLFPATVAHEILHVFGAEDYYADGNRRQAREKLADQWFPNDVMLRTYINQGYNKVGPMTAYSIGWKDIYHQVCTDPDWWD